MKFPCRERKLFHSLKMATYGNLSHRKTYSLHTCLYSLVSLQTLRVLELRSRKKGWGRYRDGNITSTDFRESIETGEIEMKIFKIHRTLRNLARCILGYSNSNSMFSTHRPVEVLECPNTRQLLCLGKYRHHKLNRKLPKVILP
jgi:hypothetical protein